MADEIAEPLLIASARRMADTHPHRHIRIVSGSGTTVGGFIAELDAYIQQVKAQALRGAAEALLESTADLNPDHPTELSYINCTRIDAGQLRRLADELVTPPGSGSEG